MRPHKLQYFFAHGLKIPASGGALLLGIAVAISCGTFSIWSVVAIFAALPLGGVLGMLVLGPLVRIYASSLNGAPFQVGDSVHILIGPHRDRVVRVYELWPSRGQVRVELGEQEEKKVKDVFWDFQVCRERASSDKHLEVSADGASYSATLSKPGIIVGPHHKPTEVQVTGAVRRILRSIVTISVLALAIQARATLMDSINTQVLIDGKVFKSTVTREQVAKTPAWEANSDFPPLSPRKAEQLANSQFHKLLKNKTDWERKKISLEPIGDETHWFYVVEFAPSAPQLGQAASLGIFVLMDGTVIEPEIANVK